MSFRRSFAISLGHLLSYLTELEKVFRVYRKSSFAPPVSMLDDAQHSFSRKRQSVGLMLEVRSNRNSGEVWGRDGLIYREGVL